MFHEKKTCVPKSSAGVVQAAATATAPLAAEVEWIACGACEKWRRVPPGAAFDRGRPFECSRNEWGELLSCDDPEETYDYVVNDNDTDDI